MKNQLKEKALDYLNKNTILNIDMIEPIRLNKADIIYAHDDGVMIHELRSNSYMLATNESSRSIDLINTLKEPKLFRVAQKDVCDYLCEHYRFHEIMECYQAVYDSKIMLEINDSLKIRLLTSVDFSLIKENYDHFSDDEIREHLSNHDIYGGYYHDQVIGFIGTHFEGSIGLLYILPEFRKMGFASQLESHMINLKLKEKLIPYAQIEIHNQKSLALQRKLGLTISNDHLYWLF